MTNMITQPICDGVNTAHYALIDDQIESAAGREKAELQKALAERVDQLAKAKLDIEAKDDLIGKQRAEIQKLDKFLHNARDQAQSSLADLTKANKRIACQSENIDTLQQQLSAERVANNDAIERLQSDLDVLKHEYAKAQTALTDNDKRITQITQDKVSLSQERDRLKSRAEIYKITSCTAGMLFLVTLFCLIVIVAGVSYGREKAENRALAVEQAVSGGLVGVGFKSDAVAMLEVAERRDVEVQA